MKRILVLVPFEDVYPPVNGGLMRCVNLLDQLAKHFSLTIIMRQDRAAFLHATDEYPALQNATIISTKDWNYSADLFSFLPEKVGKAIRYRLWNRSLKGPADTNFLLMYPILTNLLKQESFDHIILEDLSLVNLAGTIRRYQPEASISYDAYNVNTRLAISALQTGAITRNHFDKIEKAESNLSSSVSNVITCSEKDLEDLIKMNKGRLTGTVIPNGVTIKPLPINMGVNQEQANTILFCGSLDYLPNIEGLSWFYESTWPIIRKINTQAKLTVVGSGKPDVKLAALQKDESVLFAGRVPDVAPYYQEATVSIVPLLSGSGTRLKILEAMSKGVPIVSTTIGAEGIEYTNGQELLVADEPQQFAEQVLSLLQLKNKRLHLQENARQLVQVHYDWNKIGNDLAFFLNNN